MHDLAGEPFHGGEHLAIGPAEIEERGAVLLHRDDVADRCERDLGQFLFNPRWRDLKQAQPGGDYGLLALEPVQSGCERENAHEA